MTKKETIETFLEESNKIEGVYDDVSLEQAQFAWDHFGKEEKITIGGILTAHKILMLRTSLQPDEKGYFRKYAVKVGGREGANHIKVPSLIESWLRRANNVKTQINIEKNHIEFEKIHPFCDGNGRVGRIIMLYQMVKLKIPITIIYESQRQLYYAWFA